jgi:hypothetical protein
MPAGPIAARSTPPIGGLIRNASCPLALRSPFALSSRAGATNFGRNASFAGLKTSASADSKRRHEPEASDVRRHHQRFAVESVGQHAREQCEQEHRHEPGDQYEAELKP